MADQDDSGTDNKKMPSGGANKDAWDTGTKIAHSVSQKIQNAIMKKPGGSSGAGSAMGAGGAGSMKKGGTVHKTGIKKLHKGEVVLTAAQAKACGLKKAKKSSVRKSAGAKG